MNPPKLLFALALAASSLITTVQAQSWETVFQQVFDPKDLAAHPDGSIFSAGYYMDGDQLVPTVIRGTQNGTQWESVFATAAGSGEFFKMTIAPSGLVYVCGRIDGEGGAWVGSVWAGTGAGTWTQAAACPPKFYVNDIASDAAGRIYVCGQQQSLDGRTPHRWQTLKGVPSSGGISWTLIDVYSENSRNSSGAGNIAIRPSASPAQPPEIWVAGNPGNKLGSLRVMRRSLDGGATWSTVGGYEYSTATATLAGGIYDLEVGASGVVFTVGRTYRQLTKTTGEYRWLTRRSTNGGATWANVDDLGGDYQANRIAVDSSGRVFVAGSKLFNRDGGLVRRSNDGGASWHTSLTFDIGSGGYGRSVTEDSSGNIFVGGFNAVNGLIFRLTP